MTNEEFELLLQALHPQRERAARRYEEIRKKLISKFQGLGDTDPETLVDQAFDRCGSKLSKGIELQNDSPEGLIVGIANNVFKERYRKLVSQQILINNHPGPSAEEPVDLAGEEDRARRKACLRRCLGRLPAEQRRLVLAYYSGDDRIRARHHLAEDLGLTPNALRIRAHRVRARLEDCIKRCLGLRPVPAAIGSRNDSAIPTTTN